MLSSVRDDSFIKNFFLVIRFFLLQLMLLKYYVFVLFLSKNENNNGFDTIGLNSSSSDYGRLAIILFIVVSFVISPGCLL